MRLVTTSLMALVSLTVSSQAQLVVYEGFNYNPGYTNSTEWPGVSGYPASNPRILHGQPNGPEDTDAVGLAETWVEKSVSDKDNMFIKIGSMTFGDLPTSGNRIGFANNLDSDVNHRPLTSAAQSEIASSAELWFSILCQKTYVRYGANGGPVLANKVLASSTVYNNSGSDGLIGFGFAPPSAAQSKWTAYAWNGSTQYVGTASINGTSLNLIVGHISWDTGTDGADEYTLYSYVLNDGKIKGGSLQQIGDTLEVDMDQTALSRINITRNEATDYDELRIGLTLEAVLGVPPPPGTVIIAR